MSILTYSDEYTFAYGKGHNKDKKGHVASPSSLYTGKAKRPKEEFANGHISKIYMII